MAFTFESLKPSDPYYANWVEKRRRGRIYLIAFAAWFPTAALWTAVVGTFFGDDYVFPWAIIPLIVFAVTCYWRAFWPCPRCGWPFYFRFWGFHSPFFIASQCKHCGLPEYASDSQDDPPNAS